MAVTNPDASYVTNLEALVAERTDQLRKAMSDLEQTYDVTIEALGNALGMKNAASLEHSRRVTVSTIVLARKSGFSPDKIRTIARAAFLHDIGKLGVPEAILNKATALTPEETLAIQNHCWLGYEMIRRVPFLLEEAELIHAHHERWDGKGYPRGLQQETIPVGARVIAVVNAFDNLATGARPVEAAVREIADGSGTQFDPNLVRAFTNVPASRWLDIQKEVSNYNDWIRIRG